MFAAPAAAQAPATPLFASDDVIRLTINGPISAIARSAQHSRAPRDGTLTIGSETLGVRLSPRGITRLKPEVCQFPPLRVEFTQPPAATSLFRGQKRVKLVTHCRPSQGFQKHLLLEYAAYRLLNVLTPASHRARLAMIDYVDADGRPLTSRLGFFLEDTSDLGARNGMSELRIPGAIQTSRLSPSHAARAALFEYMVGNLDWSLRNGPPGSDCCHNANLIGSASGAIVPIPYDFDFTGLVNAPYAVPPDTVPVRSVRQRRYRGYCAHNAHLPAAAAEFRSKRGALLQALASIPQLDEKARSGAAAYLDGFFNDIATDADAAKLARTCVN